MARLVVVSVKVCLVRLRLAAEHAAHASSLKFECSWTVQRAHPLFDRQMQRLFMPLPIVLSLEVFRAEGTLVWQQ